MDDSIRQESIRRFAEVLVGYYRFPDAEAQREQRELRKQLDAGEPVDEHLLRPLAERADATQFREALRQHYDEQRLEEMMRLYRSLRAEQ